MALFFSKGGKALKRILIFIISIIILLCIFIVVNKNKILRIWYPQNYREIVLVYSEEFDVDENLIFAVIKAESNFDEKAKSNKNAIRINASYGKYC